MRRAGSPRTPESEPDSAGLPAAGLSPEPWPPLAVSASRWRDGSESERQPPPFGESREPPLAAEPMSPRDDSSQPHGAGRRVRRWAASNGAGSIRPARSCWHRAGGCCARGASGSAAGPGPGAVARCCGPVAAPPSSSHVALPPAPPDSDGAQPHAGSWFAAGAASVEDVALARRSAEPNGVWLRRRRQPRRASGGPSVEGASPRRWRSRPETAARPAGAASPEPRRLRLARESLDG